MHAESQTRLRGQQTVERKAHDEEPESDQDDLGGVDGEEHRADQDPQNATRDQPPSFVPHDRVRLEATVLHP